MNDANKEYYVRRVAEICAQMAQWEGGSTISGVDGRNLSDQFLADKMGTVDTDDLSPQKLLGNCKDFGIECSQLVFYHCDMWPGNMVANLEKKTIGSIEWESAGWVPKEWVRTKFRVSGGVDLKFEEHEIRIKWRRRFQLESGKRGFPEAADMWNSWRRSLRVENAARFKGHG